MKLARSVLLVFVALCAATSNLAAQGPDPGARVGSTPRILADIAAARSESERKLEAAFQKALQAIEKDENISQSRTAMVAESLKASQSAWQDFRRKQCDFLSSYYYEKIGSLGARAGGIWEYESHLIDQRIKELENPPNYF